MSTGKTFDYSGQLINFKSIIKFKTSKKKYYFYMFASCNR